MNNSPTKEKVDKLEDKADFDNAMDFVFKWEG